MPAFFPDLSPEEVRSRYVPDVIIGDLDSVRPEVRSFYEAHSTEVIDLGYDQSSTDLHKVQGGAVCVEFSERVVAIPAQGCDQVLEISTTTIFTDESRHYLLKYPSPQSLALIKERIASSNDASSAADRNKWALTEPPLVVRFTCETSLLAVHYSFPLYNAASKFNICTLRTRLSGRAGLDWRPVGSHAWQPLCVTPPPGLACGPGGRGKRHAVATGGAASARRDRGAGGVLLRAHPNSRARQGNVQGATMECRCVSENFEEHSGIECQRRLWPVIF